MSALIILLRVIHILSGIFWLGGTLMLVRFVFPTAKRLGPESGRFMQSLMVEARLPVALAISGWATTLAGLVLFFFSSGRFAHSWMTSGQGITLSIGALFGVSAALHGAATQAPVAMKLASLAGAAPAGPPSPERTAEMQTLRDKLAKGAPVSAGLLLVAATAMAIARYV
jgi:uncharacterized membrane protein